MTKLKGLMAELNVANTYGTNVPPDKAGVQAGVDAICEGLALFVVDAEVDPTTILGVWLASQKGMAGRVGSAH